MVKLILLGLVLGGISCSKLKLSEEKIAPPYIKNPNLNTRFNLSWTKSLDPVYDTGNLPISSGTPLIHDGIVYVGDQNGRFHAYNLEDGRDLWSFDEKQELTGGSAIHKDQVIYGSISGRLFSRHYLTGELKYSVDLGAAVETVPVVRNEKIFLHLRNHSLFALDAETGKILWSYKRSIPFVTTIQGVSKPLILNDKLIVGFADGYLTAFNVEDGVLLWEKKLASGAKFVDVDTDPIYKDGAVLGGSLSGSFAALDPKTGVIMKSLPLNIARAPLVLGDDIILGTLSGELIRVNSDFQILRQTKLTKGQITSIVAWKDQLAVSTTNGLIYLVRPGDFKVLDAYNLGSKNSAVFGKLQSVGDYLAAFSSRNRIYVFKK